jgi:phage I-like protein
VTRIEPLSIAIISALTPLTATPAIPGKLVALAPISNEALKGSELPTRLKLLNWGDNETATKGVVKVGKKTLASLSANQAKFGFDRVCLDYNHNSLPGHPNFQKDPRLSGGYGEPVVIEGDGLYLESLSYTPSGKVHAPEYSDLSPTPLLDETGEVIFLHSVALCPQGEVKGLTFLCASFLKPLSAKHTAVVAHRTTMDYKSLLCTLLGLDGQTATDDDIQTAAEARAKKEDADKDPTRTGNGAEEAPDDKVNSATAMAALIGKAVSEALKPLTTQFAATAAATEAEQRKAIEAEALGKGKLIPLSVKKLPFEQFKAIVAELPEGTVPVDQRTPDNVTALSATTTDGNASQVMSLLGIGKDDWEKHKPKAA